MSMRRRSRGKRRREVGRGGGEGAGERCEEEEVGKVRKGKKKKKSQNEDGRKKKKLTRRYHINMHRDCKQIRRGPHGRSNYWLSAYITGLCGIFIEAETDARISSQPPRG